MKLFVITCILCLPFYMAVGYLILHPDVSPEYRAYYVDKSTSLTIREQKEAARQLGHTTPSRQ